MAVNNESYNTYRKVDIETTSQGKLIVMLFNGAIQRAEESRCMMDETPMDIQSINNKLGRAQDIIAELRSALDMSVGELAINLDRSYEYFQYLLTQANVKKDPELLVECVSLMTDMRDTWEELFSDLAEKDELPKEKPTINLHGASVLNITS
jgi:flagellar secretion chaperone FliS